MTMTITKIIAIAIIQYLKKTKIINPAPGKKRGIG
jgi:hypothetical protein